jgi:hypothetical protein
MPTNPFAARSSRSRRLGWASPLSLTCFDPSDCFRKVVLVVAWIIFAVMAYRVAQIETEHKEYDPYVVLNIDRVRQESRYLLVACE